MIVELSQMLDESSQTVNVQSGRDNIVTETHPVKFHSLFCVSRRRAWTHEAKSITTVDPNWSGWVLTNRSRWNDFWHRQTIEQYQIHGGTTLRYSRFTAGSRIWNVLDLVYADSIELYITQNLIFVSKYQSNSVWKHFGSSTSKNIKRFTLTNSPYGRPTHVCNVAFRV